MTDLSLATPAPLSTVERGLIAEICSLSEMLDRHGLLADLIAEDELLPPTVLDEPADLRTRYLTSARDRCRDRADTFRRAQTRGRMLVLMVPFALGLAGTPYILHLLT